MTMTFEMEGRLEQHVIISQLSDEWQSRMYRLARRRAIAAGLSNDEAEDCGRDFIAYALANPDRILRHGDRGSTAEAWIYRCADNWVRNSHRGLRRLRHREIRLADFASSGTDDNEIEFARSEPGCDFELLRRELHERLTGAFASLTYSQRELYVRRFELNQSIQELAVQSRKTPNAVRQALWAVRQRLRAILTQQGFDEKEATEYLHDLDTQRPAPD